jgi:diguanylate cyclase (GGDEF)-like protein
MRRPVLLKKRSPPSDIRAVGGDDRSMPGVPVVRAAIVVGLIGFVVSIVPGLRSLLPVPATVWSTVLQPLSLIVCGSACLIRGLAVRTDRGAWLSMSLGLYSYCAGSAVFYAISASGEPAYPSAADPLFVMIYPAGLVSIGLMVRARMAGSVVSMWLDGVVSGLGLVSVSAAYAFPVITRNASGTPAAVIVNFTYPVLDLLLLAVVIGAIAALGAWRQPMWLMIGAGTLAFTGADSWFLLQLATSSYTPGSLVDVMFQVGPTLLALASTLRPTGTGGERAENRSFLVPALFALLAISVLAVGAYGRISPLGIVIAVGAVLAAWTRTALAVREVVRLSDSRRQALTDSLTGLPNRRAFYQLLDAAAAPPADSSSTDPGPAVLLVDLDRFKEINDALGHQVGDQVLTAVSARFRDLVPPRGTLARLGGDELALLVPSTSLTDAGALARALLESLEEPFAIGDSLLHVDASIGITSVLRADGGDSADGADGGGRAGGLALAKADVAMYRAKQFHSGWEIYDDARDGDAWDRLAMVEALRVAIAEDELTLEYQPIVRATGADQGRAAGVEALIRWDHPTRGRIPPDTFLPLAEHAGLMPAVTRIVLRLALDEAVELRCHHWPVPVSVNLSASDLLDDSLVDVIAQLLAERDLPGSALRIEITESLLVQGATAGGFLTRLGLLGIDLAVDDYGTGYSSLAYLHDLPLQYLKIDRGFTDRLPHDRRTAVIVASTIEMAHRLDLLVVAEGVENEDQRDWLREHDCNLLQGYHISRPIPQAKLHAWLPEHLPTTPQTATAHRPR